MILAKFDKAYWQALLLPDVSPDDALKEFQLIVGSGCLEAMNPSGKAKPRLLVRILPSDFIDHCLYKNPEGRSRADKNKRISSHYLQDRADRMKWLPEVLMEPDLVYQRPENPQELFYTKTTIDQEILVAILERPDSGATKLLTFYIVHGKVQGQSKAHRKKMSNFDIRFRKKISLLPGGNPSETSIPSR